MYPHQPSPPPPKRRLSTGAKVAIVVGSVGGVLLLCGGAVALGIAGFQAATGERSITYEASGPSTASITYERYVGDSENTTEATLPWREEVRYDGETPFMSARSDSPTGTITCRILENGRVLDEDTATGPYATVYCSGD